ncbi:MAG TPA: sugar phosphate isomerase/epimerase family protein [Bryobacteraceae bacterium]|jgi:sugar phosphate isomerase/epimerase|nr:sugar phosphate isomerase/epimerase family protein [Bryobacteraceae bacterium]
MPNPLLTRRDALLAASAAALPRPVDARPPLGLVVSVGSGQNPDPVVRRVRELGFDTCQIGLHDLTTENAERLRRALAQHRVEATAIMELGPGRMVWDFYQGPLTIGLVPRSTRAARIAALKRAADFAVSAQVSAIHTHCGFLPANPNDPEYKEAVAAIKDVASYCKARNLLFLCETGQEAPVTLLRAIEDVGLDNMRVNLDTANLILYGNGNPVDALDVLGKYVSGVHAKDGLFPTDPRNLGREVAIGQGKVDFLRVFQGLKRYSYSGAITIEREIEGPEQTKDILTSKTYLTRLLAQVYG